MRIFKSAIALWLHFFCLAFFKISEIMGCSKGVGRIEFRRSFRFWYLEKKMMTDDVLKVILMIDIYIMVLKI